jgi:hypothetical protein
MISWQLGRREDMKCIQNFVGNALGKHAPGN